MGILFSKDQGFSIGIGTLAAIFASLLTAYPTAKAVFAGEIESQIKKQTQPLTDAFYTIILQNIESQKDLITAMEFKREMCGNDNNCWTIRDARDLQRAHDALTSMEQAKASLEKK